MSLSRSTPSKARKVATFNVFAGSPADRSERGSAASLIESSTRPVLEQLEGRQMFSVPNAPFSASAAAASANTVNVAWHDNSWDETGFAVERRTTSGSYQTIGTVGTNVVNYTDYSAQGGTQYVYRISAFSAGGSSNTIETNVVATPGSAPSIPPSSGTASGNLYSLPNGPFSLTVATSGNTATLKWYANSTNELGFKIERSTDGYNFTSAGTTGNGVTSFVDSGLAAWTTYTYRVSAYNYGGTSSTAGPISASTGASTTTPTATPTPTPTPTSTSTGAMVSRGAYWVVPNAPYVLTASASGNSVNLSWSSNSTNDSGFTVQRSTDGYNFTGVGTSGPGVTSYSDYNLASGTTYTYRVYAFNPTGNSNFCLPTSVTTGGAASTPTPTPSPTPTSTGTIVSRGAYWIVPNAPFGISAVSAGSYVSLTWHSNSDNDSGFYVERSTDGYNFSRIGSTGAGVVAYSDSSVSNGTTYIYRVEAFNPTGVSSYAGPISLTFGAGSAATPTPTPTPTPSPSVPSSTPTNAAGFFPIAVYRQPVLTFPTWKARGVNTVIDFYSRDDWMQAWIKSAQANGLYEVRNPQSNISADLSDPNLLAYEHDDEPDIQGEPTSQLAAEYASWKAANPKLPIIVNVSAANAQYSNIPGVALTSSYYQGVFQTADTISSDVYPVSAWNHPQWIDKAIAPQPDNWDLTNLGFTPGNGVDAIRGLSGGKNQWAYIETAFLNNQEANAVGARGATVDEVRGETWDAIIHGAKGIVYFPFTFPGTPDGTPADVAAGMTVTDAKIASLGAVITSASSATNNYINLPGGMEATERTYGGHNYYIVLNYSHTAAGNVTINLPGLGTGTAQVVGENRTVYSSGGSITDNFSTYGVHVYMA